MKWTEEQSKVLATKCPVLVTASAGAGKTAVLTEKVVQTIMSGDGISLDRILVLTFSNAAALEMRERIRERLWQIAEDSKTKKQQRDRAYKALRLFHTANVQTIHSFCLQLIKKYATRLGIDSNVKIIDDTEACLIKNKVIKKVLASEYDSDDEKFVSLEQYIGEEIEKTLVHLFNHLEGFVDAESWLCEEVEKYNVQDGKLTNSIKMYLLDALQEANDHLQKALTIAKDCNEPKLNKAIIAIASDCSGVDKLIDKVMASRNICSSDFETIGETIRFPKCDKVEAIKEARNKGRDIIYDVFNKGNFDLESQLLRMKEMYPVLLKLEELYDLYSEMYRTEKREKKLIDFSDMERLAYEVLKDEKISRECKNKYQYAFIDEYQDTSPIQEEIIERVIDPNKLFCVGDVKQSIYRFRESDPTIFSSRSRRYENGGGNVLSLTKNFRSSQNVIDCANDVADNILSFGEIHYTREDRLQHERSDNGASIEPLEVAIIPRAVSEELKQEYSSSEIEIMTLAKMVKDLVGKPVYDPSIQSTRPTEYKDIAILTRNISSVAGIIDDIFTSNNIPFSLERTGNLLETNEVLLLIDFLSLICNIQDDKKIVAVAHSGLTEVNDEGLIAIRQVNMKSSLYENMKKTVDAELSRKCKNFFSKFEKYATLQHELTLSELVRFIVNDLSYLTYVAVRNDGAQAVANVREFISYAANFEKTSTELSNFLAAINTVKKYGIKIEEGKAATYDNAVKISTIHKSKGLEYPIVILACSGKGFSTLDKKNDIVVDKESGIGIRYFNFAKELKGRCIQRDCVEKSVMKKNAEEEKRLLYVAMTRAREKLIIEMEEPSYSTLEDAKSYGQWIMSSITDEKGELRDNLNGKWQITPIEVADILSVATGEKFEVPKDEFFEKYKVEKFEDKEEVKKDNFLNTPTSFSSSMLDKELSLEVAPFKKLELGSKTLSSAEKGTAFHNFMRYLDFDKMNNLESLDSEVERMIQEETLTQEEAKTIPLEKVKAIAQTEQWQEIVSSATSVQKEKHICTTIDASKFKVYEKSEAIVKCVIDLLVQKGSDSFIFDYKTDKFKDGTEEEVLIHQEQHRTQLMMYKEALEKCGYNIKGVFVVYTDIAKIVMY